MFCIGIVTFGVFVLVCLGEKVEVEMSLEKQLIKTLLGDYAERGKMGRPISEQNETLEVLFGLSLIQILDLDERNQVLSTNVWVNYEWKDIYLRWDPAKYGNVTTIRVPKDSVWQPDIKLYNYADSRLEEKRDALLVLSYDGTVVWIPQAIFKSSCAIDIKHFPFDVQTCKLKFGSWTYDGSQLDLSLLWDTADGFEFSDYLKSNEWDIVSTFAVKNIHKYICCPEPFIDLTFTIKIRRKPAFYNYILILPCILLSSLTLVLFWLPPESPAKMQLGMNIFVAFFVLLLLLAESTPPAASSIPLIGAYYCLNMIMITLSTFLSVIVVNLYFHGSRTEVPRFLKTVMINCMARVMCMRSQMVDKSEKHSVTQLTKPANFKILNKDRVHGENRYGYDKVGYFETQIDDNGWKGVHNNGTCGLNPETTETPTTEPPKAYANLERDVQEIKNYIRALINKTQQKDAKEKIAREWKLIALVLDRIFFFLYLLAIIISVFTVFENVFFGDLDHNKNVVV